MLAFLTLTTLASATLFALGIAFAFQWLLLRLSMRLMQPATARQVHVQPKLAHGTAQVARAFAVRR
jgi:hypothetical protein